MESDVAKVNVLTETTRQTRSSNAQLVLEIAQRNRDWLVATQKQRDRLFENIKMYAPVEGSSWDSASYNRLVNEGRHPVNIDIASRKIETLAGSIRSEKWDFDYQPISLADQPILKNIKWLYFRDKEQYNYVDSENHCLVRGLLHSATEEIDVRYDICPTGAIAFHCNQPGMVLKDPHYLSDDLKDWRRGIKHGWFTAQEMIDKWESNDPFIRQQARMDKIHGESYGRLENVDTFQNAPSRWGSKYQVIEYRWLEEENSTRLVGFDVDGKLVEFPPELKKRNEVQKYMEVNGVLGWRSIREVPYYKRTLKVAVICPSISTSAILYKGDHHIQCGFLGWFPFSACREVGVDKGIMDALKDVQRTFNYRHAKVDDILASGTCGQKVVDVTRLANGLRDLDDLRQNATRPDYMMAVEGDPKAVVSAMPHGEVPQSVWNSITELLGLFDRVSPVTPALEGTGPKEESGVLFELRHAVTKLGTLLLYDNWRGHLGNKAEAWYNQARITYKDQMLRAKNRDTNEVVQFNGSQYGVKGNKITRSSVNSIADLPRARVYVTLRRDSPTERVAERSMLFDMTKILSAHPELFKEQIRLLTNRFMSTVELDPEEKQQLEQFKMLQSVRDVLALMAEIENLKATGMQAQVVQHQALAMLNQMAQQMQQQQQMAGQQPGQISQPQVGPAEEVNLPENMRTSPEEQYTQVPLEEGAPTL